MVWSLKEDGVVSKGDSVVSKRDGVASKGDGVVSKGNDVVSKGDPAATIWSLFTLGSKYCPEHRIFWSLNISEVDLEIILKEPGIHRWHGQEIIAK